MEANYALGLAYPSVDGVTPNTELAMVLMSDYAGRNGELTGILQYTYQKLYFEKMGYKDLASAFKAISITEMIHFDLLGGLIFALGGDPKYYSVSPNGKQNWWSGSFVDYSKGIKKILLDSIAGEQYGIRQYKKLKEYTNDDIVHAILTRIILDEEKHIEILKDLLNKYSTPQPRQINT